VGFAKLLITWALSMAIYATLIQAFDAARGEATSGFAEGFISVGGLLAIPSFLFAPIVGWPTLSWLCICAPRGSFR